MALLRINRQPSRMQLLAFAIAWLAVLGAFALRAGTHDQIGLATVTAIVGLAAPTLWAVEPEWLRWLFLGLSYTTYPVGFVLSYVVLAILYYLVFTPVGRIMRWCGRDPLARTFDRAAPTYWHERPPKPTSATYLRQR